MSPTPWTSRPAHLERGSRLSRLGTTVLLACTGTLACTSPDRDRETQVLPPAASASSDATPEPISWGGGRYWYARHRNGVPNLDRSQAFRTNSAPGNFFFLHEKGVVQDRPFWPEGSEPRGRIYMSFGMATAFRDPHHVVLRISPIEPFGPLQSWDLPYDRSTGRIPRMRAYFGRYQ